MVLLNSKREARMLPGVVGAPGLERGRQSKGCGSRGVPGACHRPGHTEVPGQPREISPRDGRPPKRPLLPHTDAVLRRGCPWQALTDPALSPVLLPCPPCSAVLSCTAATVTSQGWGLHAGSNVSPLRPCLRPVGVGLPTWAPADRELLASHPSPPHPGSLPRGPSRGHCPLVLPCG